MSERNTTVGIVGMGTMGTAIQRRLQDKFDVISYHKGNDTVPLWKAAALILAIKPQGFKAAMDKLWLDVGEDQLVLSIMAGVTTESLRRFAGNEHVVRTMPNLALIDGQSVTARYAKEGSLTAEQEEMTQAILDAWGSSVRLDDEDQFGVFTAVTATAFGLHYQLMDELVGAAVQAGFGVEQARQMSIDTLRGAASVVHDGDSPAVLVGKIASPGGTTEAALDVWRANNVGATVQAMVDAATERSCQLGS